MLRRLGRPRDSEVSAIAKAFEGRTTARWTQDSRPYKFNHEKLTNKKDLLPQVDLWVGWKMNFSNRLSMAQISHFYLRSRVHYLLLRSIEGLLYPSLRNLLVTIQTRYKILKFYEIPVEYFRANFTRSAGLVRAHMRMQSRACVKNKVLRTINNTCMVSNKTDEALRRGRLPNTTNIIVLS